jgi:hypothetical protein
VYEVPDVIPPTTHDVVVDEQVNAPAEEVAVYETMEDPPVEAGAAQDIVTIFKDPTVPTTAVGTPGTVDTTMGAVGPA